MRASRQSSDIIALRISAEFRHRPEMPVSGGGVEHFHVFQPCPAGSSGFPFAQVSAGAAAQLCQRPLESMNGPGWGWRARPATGRMKTERPARPHLARQAMARARGRQRGPKRQNEDHN